MRVIVYRNVIILIIVTIVTIVTIVIIVMILYNGKSSIVGSPSCPNSRLYGYLFC